MIFGTVLPAGVCRVSGCKKPVEAQSVCKMHYARMRNTGTTDAKPRTRKTLTDEQRAEILRGHARFETQTAIARRLGVSQTAVCRAISDAKAAS